MRKATTIPVLQDCLTAAEKQLREQAAQIMTAKELGVHQQSIDKLLYIFTLSKSYYDQMKARYEANGK